MVLAMIVIIVAIDAIGRLDERRPKRPPETPITDLDARARVHPSTSPPNPSSGFTSPSREKIIVDMTDRDRD